MCPFLGYITCLCKKNPTGPYIALAGSCVCSVLIRIGDKGNKCHCTKEDSKGRKVTTSRRFVYALKKDDHFFSSHVQLMYYLARHFLYFFTTYLSINICVVRRSSSRGPVVP